MVITPTAGKNHYILMGYPAYEYDENYYWEIHLESTSANLDFVERYINEYIFIEFLPLNMIEIYYGEFREECYCDYAPFEYSRHSINKIEKGLKDEWKQKSKDLEVEYYTLLNEKRYLYLETGTKVHDNFQTIYNEHIRTACTFGLTIADIKQIKMFDTLNSVLHSFNHKSFLDTLISSKSFCGPFKDWKSNYQSVESKCKYLSEIDLKDYSLIKAHFIWIYRRTYNLLYPVLRYNHPNVDDRNVELLYKSIIEKLEKTTGSGVPNDLLLEISSNSAILQEKPVGKPNMGLDSFGTSADIGFWSRLRDLFK